VEYTRWAGILEGERLTIQVKDRLFGIAVRAGSENRFFGVPGVGWSGFRFGLPLKKPF
jgi:hypothetical protein